MAFSRPGAPAPTMSANTTGTTTAARMTAMQQRAAQSSALQAASPARAFHIDMTGTSVGKIHAGKQTTANIPGVAVTLHRSSVAE